MISVSVVDSSPYTRPPCHSDRTSLSFHAVHCPIVLMRHLKKVTLTERRKALHDDGSLQVYDVLQSLTCLSPVTHPSPLPEDMPCLYL